MNRARAVNLVLLAVLTAPAAALAAEKERVEVQVWAIRATTKNSEISPELSALAEVLKKQFKYTGFKLEKESDGRVELGKPFSAKLIGDYKASVTPKKRTAKKFELQVKVTKKGKAVLSTTVTVPHRKFMPIGCGSLDGGDYLITAVRAR